jgi:hypothetical protein
MAIEQMRIQARDVRVGDKINNSLVVKRVSPGLNVIDLYFENNGVMSLPPGRWVLVDREEKFQISLTKAQCEMVSAVFSYVVYDNNGDTEKILDAVRGDTGVSYDSSKAAYTVRLESDRAHAIYVTPKS